MIFFLPQKTRKNADLEEGVVHDDLNPQLGDGEDHNPEHRRMRVSFY